jgi:hypothetical protein
MDSDAWLEKGIFLVGFSSFLSTQSFLWDAKSKSNQIVVWRRNIGNFFSANLAEMDNDGSFVLLFGEIYRSHETTARTGSITREILVNMLGTKTKRTVISR